MPVNRHWFTKQLYRLDFSSLCDYEAALWEGWGSSIPPADAADMLNLIYREVERRCSAISGRF